MDAFDGFQPTLLGTGLTFEHDESTGMITDETADRIYIESTFFTGWTSKATFFGMVGAE
jgi:hypothetical protein